MPAAKRATRIRNPGGAKVISELPITDGSTALEIHGYTLDETGLLDSTFRLMRLVPIQWSNTANPVPRPRAARVTSRNRFSFFARSAAHWRAMTRSV